MPQNHLAHRKADYPGAITDLKQNNLLYNCCQYRASTYLNTQIGQDHRFTKARVKLGLGFFSYVTAWRTLQGYKAMNMIPKGQVNNTPKGNIRAQNHFIDPYSD